jgi:MFS family permease
MTKASKGFWIGVLALAEMAGMSLWFTSAAILPDIVREAAVSESRQALLSSAVQAGFVVGALAVSISGIADRLDPRRLFSASAILATCAAAALASSTVPGSVLHGPIDSAVPRSQRGLPASGEARLA